MSARGRRRLLGCCHASCFAVPDGRCKRWLPPSPKPEPLRPLLCPVCRYAVPHVPWRRLAEAPTECAAGRDWPALVARLLADTYAVVDLTLPLLSKPQARAGRVQGEVQGYRRRRQPSAVLPTPAPIPPIIRPQRRTKIPMPLTWTLMTWHSMSWQLIARAARARRAPATRWARAHRRGRGAPAAGGAHGAAGCWLPYAAAAPPDPALVACPWPPAPASTQIINTACWQSSAGCGLLLGSLARALPIGGEQPAGPPALLPASMRGPAGFEQRSPPLADRRCHPCCLPKQAPPRCWPQSSCACWPTASQLGCAS